MLTHWRRSRSRHLARRADAAMEQASWTDAAKLYRRAFELRPERMDLKIQQAHALKEAGEIAAAKRAYEQASFTEDDGLLHLAQLHFRSGDRAQAASALSRLLGRNPEHAGGFNALLTLGLGAYLPLGLRERLRTYHCTYMPEHAEQLERSLNGVKALMEERVEAYDAIRPVMTFAPPALDGASCHLRIIIDARVTYAPFLRATIDSLRLSDYRRWTAFIVDSGSLRDHPVASLADIDERINFVWDEVPTLANSIDVYLSAGIRLDRFALSWIDHVFRVTAAAACTCDWDSCMMQWNGPDHFFDPQLFGAFDLDRLLATDSPPPLVAICDGGHETKALGVAELRTALGLIDENRVAHIGLPLASIMRIPERAAQVPAKGSADEEVFPIWSFDPHGFPPELGPIEGHCLEISGRPGRPFLTCGITRELLPIRVIIPTRDLPDLLERMVESLFRHAMHPEHIRVTILDNRSQEAASRACLDRLSARTEIDVLLYDAPFNWSRMNNIASSVSVEPILVFANNDMEMLSDGWDHRLSGQMSRADVGIVGARLLYPDGGLQHAGMLMGLADGSPVHAGVFAAAFDAATDLRYDHVQSVSAVTGAFMAVTRSHFEELGGFDAENFAIAYNDVDLCLASRSLGRKILYDPGIELIHYESRTRGFNDSRGKIAWDQGELRALYQKWGAALKQNPGLSPWWAETGPYRSLRPLPQHVDPIILHSSWRPHSGAA